MFRQLIDLFERSLDALDAPFSPVAAAAAAAASSTAVVTDKMNSLSTMPPEIVVYIAAFFDEKTYARMRCVSRYMKACIAESNYWRKFPRKNKEIDRYYWTTAHFFFQDSLPSPYRFYFSEEEYLAGKKEELLVRRREERFKARLAMTGNEKAAFLLAKSRGAVADENAVLRCHLYGSFESKWATKMPRDYNGNFCSMFDISSISHNTASKFKLEISGDSSYNSITYWFQQTQTYDLVREDMVIVFITEIIELETAINFCMTKQSEGKALYVFIFACPEGMKVDKRALNSVGIGCIFLTSENTHYTFLPRLIWNELGAMAAPLEESEKRNQCRIM